MNGTGLLSDGRTSSIILQKQFFKNKESSGLSRRIDGKLVKQPPGV